MLLWARILPLLVALGVQAQERVVYLTPKSETANLKTGSGVAFAKRHLR